MLLEESKKEEESDSHSHVPSQSSPRDEELMLQPCGDKLFLIKSNDEGLKKKRPKKSSEKSHFCLSYNRTKKKKLEESESESGSLQYVNDSIPQISKL